MGSATMSLSDFDKKEFKSLFDGLAEIYNPDKPMSKMALQIYFNALSDYSIDQIANAVTGHVTNPKHGTFFPKVADLIRQLQGGEISADEIISAARLHKTPLGVLCRIHIGHWDLAHQTDMFYLRQRAQECIDLLPEWKSRAMQGEYTDHEIACLLKYEVDPVAPFHNALPAPQNAAALRLRAEGIKGSSQHLALLERPHAHDKSEEQKGIHPDISEKLINILEGE
jgi:hypothetical protein